MTRFARAKGSKSSNERHPEEATPWHEMKQQMQKKQEQRHESKEVSPKKYMVFTESEISSSTWAQFEDGKPEKKKMHSKRENRNVLVGMPTVSDLENRHSNKKDILHKIADESSKVKKKISKKRRKESEMKGRTENEDSEKTAEQEDYNQSKTKAISKALNSQTNKGTVKICRNETSGYKKSKTCGRVEPKIKSKNKPIFEKRKFKNGKERDGKYHKQIGSEESSTTMFINGKEIQVVKYDGFPVKKEDAIRLAELRAKLKTRGIPHESIVATMKLERRRAEKALARERKKVCFHCRKSGHVLSDCPELTETTETEAGICFKCGSTEHTHFRCKVSRDDDYRYASCFICKEQGHIARQCPDNPRGLYPKGGACKVCGAVTHLKKDCPNLIKEKEQQIITLKPLNNSSLEALEDDLNTSEPATKVKKAKKKKAVKF